MVIAHSFIRAIIGPGLSYSLSMFGIDITVVKDDTHSHTHIHTHTSTHTCTYTHAKTHIHMHIYIQKFTHTQTHMHSDLVGPYKPPQWFCGTIQATN